MLCFSRRCAHLEKIYCIIHVLLLCVGMISVAIIMLLLLFFNHKVYFGREICDCRASKNNLSVANKKTPQLDHIFLQYSSWFSDVVR